MVSFLSRRPLRAGLHAPFGTIGFGVADANDHLGAHPRLPLANVIADARTVSSRVIVIMRDQLTGRPATRGKIGARIRAEASVDSPVIATVQRSGGRSHHRYVLAPVVSGTLYVDNFSHARDFGNELLAIPYEYETG